MFKISDRSTSKFVGIWMEDWKDPLSEEIVIKGNSVKQIIHTLLNVTVDEGTIEIFELENHSEEAHLIKTIRVFEELRLIP